MRVAVLAAGTETTLGGETRVACELAESLAKNVETAFVFTGKSNRTYKEGELTKVSLEGGETNYNLDTIPVYSPSTIQYFFNFLAEFKPDIIHSHSVWAAPFLGQVWAIANDIPYMYTTHMMPSRLSKFFEMDEGKIMHRILNDKVFKGYFVEFLNNCSGIIALNDVAKADIYNYGYNGKSYILPNGRYLNKFNKLAIPNVEAKQKNLIFIGSVTVRKNQEYLVKMMKYLPKNYHLTLIGRFFFEDYEKKFRKMASKYKNVDVLGGIEPTKVPEYLEQSHLFVSASLAEVQSLSIIEALAAGKPIVGLSNETVDEMIDSSVGTWLPKTASPKEFANAVKNILEKDNASYLSLTKAARERVELLDWPTIARKTQDVYSLVLDDYKKQEGKYIRNVHKLLNLVPDFFGKAYIVDQIDNWNASKKESKGSIIKGVPGKTLLFAGITVGAVALAYQGLKVAKAFRKKKKAAK